MTPTSLAAARFFLRIGQVGRGRWKDDNTMPLFPLTLVMEAEGLLARDAQHLTSPREKR